MPKVRGGTEVKRIGKKDGELFKAIARTGVVAKNNSIKYLNQNDRRLQLLEKQGYIEAHRVVTRAGTQNVYRLGSAGRDWVKNNSNVTAFYRSNNRQVEHDLKLSQAYFQTPAIARESWLNEHMIQDNRQELSNGKIDKGGVDAMVTVNGVTIGIEIITGNYGRDEITEKIETAQALGCERLMMIKC